MSLPNSNKFNRSISRSRGVLRTSSKFPYRKTAARISPVRPAGIGYIVPQYHGSIPLWRRSSVIFQARPVFRSAPRKTAKRSV